MAGVTDITTWTDVITTGANGLVAGGTATSNDITPPTGPVRLFMEVGVALAFMTPVAGQTVTVSILPSIDTGASVFADVSASRNLPPEPLESGASTKEIHIGQIDAPINAFRVALTNSSGGASLAASGNVVRVRFYSVG